MRAGYDGNKAVCLDDIDREFPTKKNYLTASYIIMIN